MPVRVVGYGDEFDKDLALGIRYAVDDGAQIVNMSFGKDFSPNAKWVHEAIAYAAAHDVLVITIAGNEGQHIDSTYSKYPNDYKQQKEFVENFITVGATTSHADSGLVANFSNYGKQHVDLFAPGRDIYMSSFDNTYKFASGTSCAAPVVSGVAALIRSFYPKLNAVQVKEILLKSGTSYDLMVTLSGTEKETSHFSKLSKSGRMVNAYNALLMADEFVNP